MKKKSMISIDTHNSVIPKTRNREGAQKVEIWDREEGKKNRVLFIITIVSPRHDTCYFSYSNEIK